MITKINRRILQYQNAQRYCQRPNVQAALKYFDSVEQNELLLAIPTGGFADSFADICARKRLYSLLSQRHLRELARQCKLSYADKSRFELVILIENFEARKFKWRLTLPTQEK